MLDVPTELTVLVLGGGGREHALVLALAADPTVAAVHAAPGNPGTAEHANNHPVDPLDPAAVAALAKQLRVDLVVVGPEAPLVAGVADAVRAAGIACFGPSAAAARIEGSKAFAKDVMAAAGVPTAGFAVCSTPEQAAVALDDFGPPYVVKDDGLASGKGVVVTDDRATALTHAASCASVVVEEFLDGPEVSLFAITDGRTVRPLQPAQDFKRRDDGDAGPNTGGMGAYTPLPWAPPDLVAEVTRTVLQPTVDELARRGTPFCGLLYAGLALTRRGVRVVEFNARFGDPETQALLPLLRTPLGRLLYAAATGRLEAEPDLDWDPGAAVAVVLAAEGYPAAPVAGGVIQGLALRQAQGSDGNQAQGTDGNQAQGSDGNQAQGSDGNQAQETEREAVVVHAGTAAAPDGRLVSAGGRVLAAVGRGPDLSAARDAAYRTLNRVELAGSFFRTDIAADAARDRAHRS